jgi:hypothetical protein
MQNVKLIRIVTPKASIVDGKTCIEDEVRDLRVQFTDDDGRVVSMVFDGNADCTDGAFNGTKREVYSLHPEVTIMQEVPGKTTDLSDLSIRPMSQVVDALLGPNIPEMAIICHGGVVQEVRTRKGDADIIVYDFDDCDEDCDVSSQHLASAFPVVVY